MLRPDVFPLAVEENYAFRAKQFLKCPASSKPSALAKGFMRKPGTHSMMIVRKINVTDVGFLIPCIHGIDGFRELGAARLIDAAGIDPRLLEST